MKAFLMILISALSMNAFSADPNLDPNQNGGNIGGAAVDINKFVSAQSKADDCEPCHAGNYSRHAPTAAAKAGKSAATGTSKPNSTGIDGAGNN